jgi:lipopolysaccharide export system protein LptA
MAQFQEIGWWHKVNIRAILIGMFVLCLPYVAGAEAFKNELVITSDQLEMDEGSEIATFIGSVVAREGEMSLFADRMVVYYFKKGRNDGRGGVHKVLAIGSVIIEQASNKGQADRAEYIVGERKLILIGKNRTASIFHGGDRLAGKRILLTLGASRKIDKVSVLGTGKQRVSARIMPSSIRNKKSKQENPRLEKPQLEKEKKKLLRVLEAEESPRVEQEKKSMKLQIDSKPLSQSVGRVAQKSPKPKRRPVAADRSPPLVAPKFRVE